MGKLTIHSSVEEVDDFIIYHKYLSFDVNYGEEIERFLMRAEDIIDALPKQDKAPPEIIQKLIDLLGDEYGWL